MAQINKPNDYFNTVLYTGNGTDNHVITGVGFQPEFFWGKERSSTSGHYFVDIIRGTTKYLSSNSTGSDGTYTDIVKSFNADGFTLGTNTVLNESSQTNVAWNWLAGGTGVSNTAGSITSTVSANTTSGFSIVSYTGTGVAATIGHGLGAAPSMIICKNRIDAGENWPIYHKSLGASAYILLNTTGAALTSNNTSWNGVTPTSTVFSVQTDNRTNGSGDAMIAYCFAEKKGFSKFGSWTGNGSTDGTFVYTGFKPAMVILKDYTSASNYNWIILDNKRDPSNSLDRRLQPSSNLAEYTDVSDFCDFTSNGFKWRGSQANWNGSGVGYIYMAFAENPLVGTNNIPATAR